VRDILDEALLEPNHITYPLPDFIIGCGFFCVLFVEKLVMRLSKRRDQVRDYGLAQNTGPLNNQNMPAISQGSVSPHLKCDGIFNKK